MSPWDPVCLLPIEECVGDLFSQWSLGSVSTLCSFKFYEEVNMCDESSPGNTPLQECQKKIGLIIQQKLQKYIVLEI